MSIKLLAIGSHLPQTVVSNLVFEKTLDTNNDWITQMTGIKERRILDESEDYLDCCHLAASNAINRADINPNLIDLIIVGTTTPYQLMPSTAVMLQQKLKIEQCIAFDMQAACSGFIYALANAIYVMQANPNINYALVMGCDSMSKVTSPNDRTTRILFGDGFGAFLLMKDKDENQKGFFYVNIGADGLGKNSLEIPWGIAKGFSSRTEANSFMTMNGPRVFKNAVERFTKSITNALNQTNLTANDIHHVITHQANIRIITQVANNLELTLDRVHVTLDKHGNTSAASIPLAADDLFTSGKMKQGEIILLSAFGAGYTWGTIILEF
ncbi:beta-ketoacyl-ACP synthase III [Legionella maioricensis]|uniref:Ketoacyl-ACP synthase III n=1 Tax=Legionella maioricensis TaxID=2896528 RepID=A0A9X2ICQ1_9GAMM|nr:beta-ketoacyl-ACP synthase III [Legionella maioricensis]MCL9685670.1 ketoacyl-ACP synthase III [Legionella maioricensis]MCL9689064.1 ketoacyl-ACP synthase III [Legionella maioricensis]